MSNETNLSPAEEDLWKLLGIYVKPGEVAELFRVAFEWADTCNVSPADAQLKAKKLIEIYLHGRIANSN